MLKAILTIVFALSLIVGGDTAGKLLVEAGFSPFSVAWLRFAIAVPLVLPFSGLTWRDLPEMLSWKIALRAALIAGGICCILTALRSEPVADVFGAFFIGPIVAYILSVVLLKERVSLLRTFLLLIGFAGVMLVVRPGFGAGPGIVFALAAGALHGAYLVATRWLAPDYRPRFLLMSQLIIGAVLLTPAGLSFAWPSAESGVLVLIVLSALGSAAGNYLLVIVSRTTPASLIAPLVYTQLISATAAGLLVFGEWPDPVTLIGLVVILASGLLSFIDGGGTGRKRPRRLSGAPKSQQR